MQCYPLGFSYLVGRVFSNRLTEFFIFDFFFFFMNGKKKKKLWKFYRYFSFYLCRRSKYGDFFFFLKTRNFS